MLKTIPALVLMTMLAGCATTASRITCPPLKEYSDRTKQRIAADIRAIKGKFPALEGFVVDATKLRDAARTCKAHRGVQRK